MNTAEKITTLKVPPHSIDAEQALIGAILSRPDAIHDLELTADEFYRREHRAIWGALVSMAENRKAIDAITLRDALVEAGTLSDVGGIDYIADLVESGFGSANFKAYAQIIRDRALERRLISISYNISDIAYGDGDAQDKLDQAAALFNDLEVQDANEPVNINDCLKESIAELEKRYENKGQIQGLATGFADLDAQLLGLANGDLVIVAGRPSMGKTTLAMNIAEHVSMIAGQLVIVFSLEMSRRKLTDRMVCSLGKIDNKRFKTGDLSNDEFDKVSSAVGRLRGKTLFVDDTSQLTSSMLLSRARRIARRLNMKPALVVVDYLQLLADKGEGVDRVTKISRNLKLTAQALDCPLMALSQLSRKCEERSIDDRRPVMSDLRESGAIEQDADVILMVYRHEVYAPERIETKGIGEAIIRKARDGELGTAYLSAQLHRCRFENMTYSYSPPAEQPTKKGGFNY